MVKSTHVCLAETWKKILPNSSHTEMCRVIASWANELVMIFSWNSKWIWKHKISCHFTVDSRWWCLFINISFHSIPSFIRNINKTFHLLLSEVVLTNSYTNTLTSKIFSSSQSIRIRILNKFSFNTKQYFWYYTVEEKGKQNKKKLFFRSE